MCKAERRCSQQLGGWESAQMVRQYAHLAAQHLKPSADRLAEHNDSGTNLSQRAE